MLGDNAYTEYRPTGFERTVRLLLTHARIHGIETTRKWFGAPTDVWDEVKKRLEVSE